MRGIATEEGSRARLALATLCTAVVLLTAVIAATAAAQEATNEEYALLVLANQARSEPSAFGYGNPAVLPLVWNDGLARAARAHSEDMAVNGCYQHDSCNGQVWWKRLQAYFPGWSYLAENIIAVGSTPESMHRGWMNSAGHRANILSGSLVEFGAGLATGRNGFGEVDYGTEDFGTRGLISLRLMPPIPAAAVFPRQGPPGQRRLAANFYDYDGAPQSVRALVGGSCVELELEYGKPANGTYAASRAFQGEGCVPLVFEAVRADGSRFRFPRGGAILIGVGDADCAQRSSTAPPQDCGGPDRAPAPTPSPTPPAEPEPSPGSEAALPELRVVLRPGPPDASLGQVNVAATLPSIAGFDPTGVPIRMHIGFASGDWSRTLPALCDGTPCLQSNPRGTTYHASYGSAGPRLSFVRGQDGLWRLRYWSRGETLGRIAPGPVTLEIAIGDVVLVGAGEGELRENKLVAR
jgi:uncharacterized protein YkwD